MQSKFPSDYFVFLKSVGLVRRRLGTDCDAAVIRSTSGLSQARGAGEVGEDPLGFLGFWTLPPTPPPFWFGNFGYLWA